MSRLVDRILAQGFDARTTGTAGDSVRALLADVPVFVVDNVAEYIWSVDGDGREVGKDWERDFPNVAPPFPAYWMEYRVPFRPDGRQIAGDVLGALVQASDLGTGESPRWQVTATIAYCAKEASRVPILVSRLTYGVEGEGDASGPFDATWVDDRFPVVFGMDDPGKSWPHMYAPLLATSLLHCRNVQTLDGQPPRHERRQFEREFGRPTVRFHTLDIQPMRRVLAQAGAETIGVGLRKALHIARGHFKTFGGEHGKLFGKIEGRFWWPDQVRGSPERGAVVKDYRVQPPEPPTT